MQKRDVFADVTSGSRTAIERPGMKRLLDYVESGDTVVVWRIDRLGRSLIDVLNTVNFLRDREVKIQSLSDGIDPETTSGRLMLGMLATLAEYERELITERVNAGIAAAKQNGTRFGRPPVDPTVIAEKLAIAQDARVKGRTAEEAARLVGWSRATLYRHQHTARAHDALASTASTTS
ncbi:recombinase family protein [Dietzia maris]|uniref:Recombinase family protein n=1 Tax=Dietzia maris TaxID=37915 RepID=A0ABT8H561_9ACTN|nr:recombinase family protein [Dietzia maris]MDN4507607.1 recombinase family protein [Dietzia maris]